MLLLLRAVSDQPLLLTSTFHVLQGAVEIKDVRLRQDRLIVKMEKPGRQFGQLVFAVPPEHPVGRVLVNDRPQWPCQISAGIWRAGFTLSDRATVEFMIG